MDFSEIKLVPGRQTLYIFRYAEGMKTSPWCDMEALHTLERMSDTYIGELYMMSMGEGACN